MLNPAAGAILAEGTESLRISLSVPEIARPSPTEVDVENDNNGIQFVPSENSRFAVCVL
jgi:hypothetical protein